MNETLLVVGGGLAGVKTIEAARDAGHTGPIILATDENDLPYDRPPLSKETLSTVTPTNTTLWTQDRYAEQSVDLRLGLKAATLDRDHKNVHFENATSIGYDKLVIATGARARLFPGADLPGIHTIRTLTDAQNIARELAKKPHVVIIGAGFIGAEVASTARQRGCEVTIIEAASVPLLRALGEEMGRHCISFHEKNGVSLLTDQKIQGFTGSTHVTGVITSSGTIQAGLVVVGIGSSPNTDWLQGSGLNIDNGVFCDENGHADNSGDVFCVGDVSAWLDPLLGTHQRHEHWTAATEQAKIVGQALAGLHPTSPLRVPYFWSDQHGTKIQMIGTAHPNDEIAVLYGSVGEGTFLVAYHQNSKVSALLAFGMPRLIARHRKNFVPGQDLATIRTETERINAPAPIRSSLAHAP